MPIKTECEVRFAELGGEDLIVSISDDGQKILIPLDFSQTEVLIQQGRFALLSCLPAALRVVHHVGCNVLTQVEVEDRAGMVFVAKNGVIFLSDLPVGQFVEVLPFQPQQDPNDPEDGPAVRVFLPIRPNVLTGAVAMSA